MRTADRILAKLHALDPCHRGALQSTQDFRLDLGSPPDFDSDIMGLARNGDVALHRTDDPYGLTDDERSGMVPDGRGGYFIGVALRG